MMAQEPKSASFYNFKWFFSPPWSEKNILQGPTDSNNSLHLLSTYSLLDTVLRTDVSTCDADGSPWSIYDSPCSADG